MWFHDDRFMHNYRQDQIARERQPITPATPFEDMMQLMAEGDIGAACVMTVLMQKRENIMTVLELVDMNIRGEQLWHAYKDFCDCSIDKLIEACRNRDQRMVTRINIFCMEYYAVTRGTLSHLGDLNVQYAPAYQRS